jgi:hypothetical protein
VRAAAHAAYRHRIPIRDGVLDVEAVVGEDTPTPLCVFPGVAVLVFKNGHVLEMVLRHELLEGCEAVVFPDLFYHPTHHCLLLLGSPSHSFPLFGQLDRAPLGLPQSGLDRDARLPPDHLVAALIRVEETEDQHRAHVGHYAVERALGRDAAV